MLRRAFWIGLFSSSDVSFFGRPVIAAPNPPGGGALEYLTASAGEICPFPLRIDITAAQAVRTTLPNGLLLITGPATATVTNTESQESLTYNISGPGTFDPTTKRYTLFGQSLIVQPSSVGTPFLITTSGRVSFIENQSIDQPLRGHISHDICSELG